MAEIGATSHISNWLSNRAVSSTHDTNQSPKRQSKKNKRDDEKNPPASARKKNKKKPPGNNMNPHIDEYA